MLKVALVLGCLLSLALANPAQSRQSLASLLGPPGARPGRAVQAQSRQSLVSSLLPPGPVGHAVQAQSRQSLASSLGFPPSGKRGVQMDGGNK